MRRRKKRQPRKLRKTTRRQGQKEGFEIEEVQTIDRYLMDEENLFEQTLFHIAIDTMLRSSDLLALTLEDVTYASGRIKTEFVICQQKTGVDVKVVLMESTKKLLEQFVKKYNKSRKCRLFDKNNGIKITSNWFRRFIKRLAKLAGIEEIEKYSGHSTRRTKAMFMCKQGSKIGTISKVLGHSSIVATILYLGLKEKEIVEELKAHDTWGIPTKQIYRPNLNSSDSHFSDLHSMPDEQLIQLSNQCTQIVLDRRKINDIDLTEELRANPMWN